MHPLPTQPYRRHKVTMAGHLAIVKWFRSVARSQAGGAAN